MTRYVVALAAVTAMLSLVGCGETSPSPSASEQERTVTERPPQSPEPSARPERRGVVADAVGDLAERLGVDPDGIRVASAEEVTWRDGSMGCPRPGMMYPQVLTNGSRVVLEVDGRTYEYHAGGRRSAFLCENPQKPAPG